ncbi:MAG: hypothetical protein PHE89_00380 [Alphaproteobacteria bacterium]|nr:hypothetical protein [Alphaproteobacteria bacterium]
MECLSALNEDQQVAYMKALSYLAKVDGHVDESEKEFLSEMAVFHGVSTDRLSEISANEDIEKVFNAVKKIDDRRAALELIKDMCLLAHQDDVLSDEEVLYIGQIGEAMNVSLDKIEQISRWIIDRIIWLEESKIIFEEN